MENRRERLLDAAISVLGESGMRALTHRAVDAAAGVPTGSTSNYFRSRDALLDAVVERFAARERANWDDLAATASPTTPAELAQVFSRFLRDAAGPQRTLTLARYAILIEGAIYPPLRAQLGTTGARVYGWFVNWLRAAGCAEPERIAPIVMNHSSGILLHELANPNPAFDPTDEITALVNVLLPARRANARA